MQFNLIKIPELITSTKRIRRGNKKKENRRRWIIKIYISAANLTKRFSSI